MFYSTQQTVTLDMVRGETKKNLQRQNDRKVVFICTFCLKGADCLQIDDGAYGRGLVSLTCCRPSSPCERRGPRGGSSSPIRCRTTTRASRSSCSARCPP